MHSQGAGESQEILKYNGGTGVHTKMKFNKVIVCSLPVVLYQKLRATIDCGPVLTFLKVFIKGE